MVSYTFFLIGGVLFGLTTAIIGFIVGVWFSWVAPEVAKPSNGAKTDNASVEAEVRRACAASDTLAVLAKNMVSDVNAHTIKIESISADLDVAATSDKEKAIPYEEFPIRILDANYELQRQLAKAKEQIEKQATQLRLRESEALTDSLTALSNRRAFEDEMRKRLAAWERNATPFSLLMLDIDHFKRFNDSHGHQTGDAVISEVAHVLDKQLRDMDTGYRYGGEEFAVLLPSTLARDSGIVAERIRSAIERTTVKRGNKTLKVTISVGFTEVISGDKVEEIVRRADEALYQSKSAGRNCVHLHNGREVMPLGQASKSRDIEVSAHHCERNDFTRRQVAFKRELTSSVCDSRRTDAPLTIISIHADDHNADRAEVLKENGCISTELAIKLIESHLGKNERLVRFTKNELLVLSPGTELSDAQEFMQEIDLHGVGFTCEAFQLLPNETAEQFLLRTRPVVAVLAEKLSVSSE